MWMIDYPSLAGRLGNVQHFMHLAESDREVIVSAGQVLAFPAGSFIFKEGDPCAGIYVLFSGRVNLYKLGLQGQECILDVIDPVIMFNEVSVIDGKTNPFSAVATQDCLAWRIRRDPFIDLMGRYPELGTGLLQVLALRTRKMIDHFEDLLSRTVRARTAKVILDISARGEKTISRRQYSNLELAALAATCPEALSRSLRTLREAEVIECTRKEINVNQPEQLAEMALIDYESMGLLGLN
jgi:CRP/FNR family transcriptional regulator